MPEPEQTLQPGANARYGPLTTLVGVAPIEGKQRVVLRVESATGMHIYLLDADHAEALAKMLAERSLEARSGLQVVKK